MDKEKKVPVIGSHLLATKHICKRYRIMNLVVDDGYASVKASDYEPADFLNPDIWVNYTSLFYGHGNYQPPHKIEIQNFVDGWEMVIMITGREVNGEDVRFKFKAVSFNKFLDEAELRTALEKDVVEPKPKPKAKSKSSVKKADNDKVTSNERLVSAIKASKKLDKDSGNPKAVI